MFSSSKISNYSIIDERFGEGAFGVVMKAQRILNGEIVALKKIRIKKEHQQSFPLKVLRELKTLQHSDHENILELQDFFALGSTLVLVLEFCPTDLGTILRIRRTPLPESHIKTYLQQLLRGISYLHSKNIAHRDIKPANLLIGMDGRLKIGDFGLATLYLGPGRTYSHQVASRWYRSPELLYGSQTYDPSVDIYAVGMVFAEMLNHSPLLRGESDIDQLTRVVKTFGLPNEKIWPGVTKLPDFKKIKFPNFQPVDFKDLLPNSNEMEIDLLKKLVCYDPKKRISAKDALMHKWFFNEPYPVHITELEIHRTKLKKEKKFKENISPKLFLTDL